MTLIKKSIAQSFTYRLITRKYMNVSSVEISKHALEKMRARAVEIQDIRETIGNPALLFEDVESKALVAIRQIRSRYLVVVYALKESTAKIITVYHSTNVDRLIRNKVERDAWLEKEKRLEI